MIYKVSYVVEDDSSPGILKNEENRPQIGELVHIGSRQFEIVDVAEIIPPKNDEAYILVMLAEKRA